MQFLIIIIGLAVVGSISLCAYAGINWCRQSWYERQVKQLLNKDIWRFDYQICEDCYRLGFAPSDAAKIIRQQYN